MFIKVNDILLFLGNETSTSSGALHGCNEQVISDNVEFLLVISSCIGGASEAGKIDQGCSSDVVGYGLEGELQGLAEEPGRSVSRE